MGRYRFDGFNNKYFDVSGAAGLERNSYSWDCGVRGCVLRGRVRFSSNSNSYRIIRAELVTAASYASKSICENVGLSR